MLSCCEPICLYGWVAYSSNPSDIWVSKDGADWTLVSETPWNNDPDWNAFIDPYCQYTPPGLVCDNIRYDFDMLTVMVAKAG